jgi:poly(hydroxyalkanoate) depolymerase family esterase
MRPFPFSDPFGLLAGLAGTEHSGSRLKEHFHSGPNPGALRLFAYRPRHLRAGAPLVVMLHGCRQDARSYDHGAGWSVLADRLGFALVAPEQTLANNVRHCFNWFLPEHNRRGAGEAASIREMIAWALKNYDSDPARIFITGLSAGGAMSAVMLAAYPELFAAGAVIAGLPYGAANSVQQAIAAMQYAPGKSAKAWGDAVRQASGWKGPWPRVTLWQGDNDETVNPANLEALVAQWVNLHEPLQEHDELGPGLRHRLWRDGRGAAMVEAFTIAGLGHGTPIHATGGRGRGEHAGPFILEAGISSSAASAQFFGLGAPGVPHPRGHFARLHGIITQAMKAARLR